MANQYWIGWEEVNGVIIGEITWPYKFYTRDGECVGQGWFQNDTEAENYCKEKFPEHYANGMEMRCYDQDPVPGRRHE